MNCVRKRIFTLIWTFSWVSSVTAQDLSENELVNKHFEKNEVAELEKIIRFFDDQLKKSCTSGSTLSQCYTEYAAQLKQMYDDREPLDFQIPIKAQEKLFQELDQEIFDEIWEYGKGRRRVSRNEFIDMQFLSYNFKGKYINFIEDLAKEKDVLKPYIAQNNAAGDLSPSTVSYLIRNHDQFDTDEAVDRLVLAVHYLTVNANNDR